MLRYMIYCEKGECSLENDKLPNDIVKQQQMNPGGAPPFNRRPQREERQGRPEGPGRPEPGRPMGPPPQMAPEGPPPMRGREEQPRTAPPNFIPQPPGMEQGPGRGMGPERRGPGFGRPGRPFEPEPMPQTGEEFRGRIRGIRGCVNRFTYIWLFNGENFWFYPTFVDNRFVRGFRWRRDRWVFDRIYINRIFFFRCY